MAFPDIFALDGGDGSGKTTVAHEIVNRLDDAGIPVRLMRDPGSTKLGEAIREILLNRTDITIDPMPTLLLFAATSAQMMADARKFAAAGEVVILDRCYVSNLAYRYADGIPVPKIMTVAIESDVVLPPDHVFYINVPVEERQRRLVAAGRGVDRFESRGADFARKVSEGYEKVLHHMTLIDGNRPVAAIAQDITNEITMLMRRR